MSDQQVTVIAHLRAKPGSEEAIKKAALKAVAATRDEQGCINYDFHQRRDDPRQFVFYENWTSKAALDVHARTPHLDAFRAEVADHVDGAVDVQLWNMISTPNV